MFDTLLIANRGEIAVRVARTAKRLGIRVVAVYSDADADAPHVRIADHAVRLGPAPATDSYLRIDRVIAAAVDSGADAVHPGYGFLSENAEFADALDAAGVAFVGPTAETIRSMGSKAAAKDLMAAAGVPVLPGYQGEEQSLATFLAEAKRIGYPVLLKAAAGGGGKGMRLVDSADELEGALASAQREARSAFGDDRFIVEKYLAEPRHVEVQIFGDGKGDVVHVFERDCSVQRRHQKIIEEAPAPGLPPAVRQSLLDAGVRAGAAINYRGAGTVEFLYDGADGVYFMEMNTRLQVEHPVSEAISGLDFVEWQLRIAAGEGLPLKQDDIREHGHAFESRLYAENPERDFAPSTGTITHLELPSSARVDSGVEAGLTISPHYDPMIAKIITAAADRKTALARMSKALAVTRVAGLDTNARFLHALTIESDFVAGKVSTAFIEQHASALFATEDIGDVPLVAAALSSVLTAKPASDDPWDALAGWRANRPNSGVFAVLSGDRIDTISLSIDGRRFSASIEESAAAADRKQNAAAGALRSLSGSAKIGSDDFLTLDIDGRRYDACVAPHRDGVRVWLGPVPTDIRFVDIVSTAGEHKSAEGSLDAPMPGVVISVAVNEGDEVKAGDTLLVLEAMKMEHQVHAPSAGIVRRVLFKAGAQVSEGDLLIELEAESA